jgi:hypothetical protein
VRCWKVGSQFPTALRDRAESVKGSQKMGAGRIIKYLRALHFNKKLPERLTLLSARSISMFITFMRKLKGWVAHFG